MIRLLQLKGALVIAFLLVILVSITMKGDTTCIYSHRVGGYHEQFGIVGIELCHDQQEWDRFFQEACPPTVAGDVSLKKKRVDFLLHQIHLDYLLIAAYGLFLFLLGIILFPHTRKWLALSVLMTILVITLDILENHFLRKVVGSYLCSNHAEQQTIADMQKEYFFSVIKWTLLLLLIVLLAKAAFKRWKWIKPLVYGSLLLILIFIWQPHPDATWNINFGELVLGWMFILWFIVFVKTLFIREEKSR